MLRCWLGIITLDRRHPGAFLNYSGGAGVLAPRRCSATMQREDETNEQIHSRCPTVTLTSEWFSATTNLNFEPSKSCPLYLLIAEASKHIQFFSVLDSVFVTRWCKHMYFFPVFCCTIKDVSSKEMFAVQSLRCSGVYGRVQGAQVQMRERSI